MVETKILSAHLQQIVDDTFPMLEQITGVDEELACKNDRRRFVVDARKILVNILRKQAGLTCMQIAKIIGKDHSTVVFYEKMHKVHMIEPDYRQMYSAVSGMYSIKNTIRTHEGLKDQFDTLQYKTRALLNSLEQQCDLMAKITKL
jgi:aerobic-type carbon monoxide dehydrogenase small subunit (CoxS/CutS family)|tara:strand:- start:876 stop:1313 length:438 start_codon:yes stop_codon:yes gene_type:complete